MLAKPNLVSLPSHFTVDQSDEPCQKKNTLRGDVREVQQRGAGNDDDGNDEGCQQYRPLLFVCEVERKNGGIAERKSGKNRGRDVRGEWKGDF